MRGMMRLTLCWIALGLASRAHAEKPGVSGLARIRPGEYIGVFDHKRGESGPRLASVRIRKDGSARVRGRDLGRTGNAGEPSDLEAACVLEGLPGEALVLESGEDGPSARLFHLVGISAKDWAPRVAGIAEVAAHAGKQNLEGLVCVTSAPRRALVIFGERGGSSHHPEGRLRWAQLDLAAHALEWTQSGRTGLAVRAPAGWESDAGARAISDLHLDASGTLWAGATLDPGDAGPFRSAIYALARAQLDADPPLRLVENPRVAFSLDGFKVEGIAAPPGDGAFLAIATEDEDLGGAVRTLARPQHQR